MKWIRIEETGGPTKTKTFLVWTGTAPDIKLGRIRFYPRWRKFAFYPEANTLYEKDCLRDIAQFCEEQTEAWRDSLKRRAPVVDAMNGRGDGFDR